jgi:hypothetical protein
MSAAFTSGWFRLAQVYGSGLFDESGTMAMVDSGCRLATIVGHSTGALASLKWFL